MASLTLDDLQRQILALRADLRIQDEKRAELQAVLVLLAARLGDFDLVTVKEAAQIEERLYGKGTVATIRRKLADGTYTAMRREGEKADRISVKQMIEIHRLAYVPVGVVRAAREAEKRER